jgi:hypothetical protein
MYHTSGYLDYILDPKISEEHEGHRDDASEREAMKLEYGLEDVGHLSGLIQQDVIDLPPGLPIVHRVIGLRDACRGCNLDSRRCIEI